MVHNAYQLMVGDALYRVMQLNLILNWKQINFRNSDQNGPEIIASWVKMGLQEISDHISNKQMN